MCIKWIEYKGAKILYQGFSEGSLLDTTKAKEELALVQEIILSQPLNSVRVLTDFRETYISKDLIDVMADNSRVTGPYVKKMAALGADGPRRIMACMVASLSDQPITFFEDVDAAQEWLVAAEPRETPV